MLGAPEKLSVLFRMKYLECARGLGVKRKTVKQYVWRLWKRLVQQGVLRDGMKCRPCVYNITRAMLELERITTCVVMCCVE